MGWNKNLSDTGRGIYLVSLFFVCLLAGLYTNTIFPAGVLPFFLGVIVAALLYRPLVFLLTWLLRLVCRANHYRLVCSVFILASCSLLAMYGDVGVNSQESAIVGFLYGVVLLLAVTSLIAVVHGRCRNLPGYIVLGISMGFALGGIILLIMDGFPERYQTAYLARNEQIREAKKVPGFDTQLDPGGYTVDTLTYGIGKEKALASDTVDLSFCVEDEDGLTGLIRKQLGGYDVTKAAVAGRIWYPKEVTDCPALFIVHGNHSIWTKSYLGYDYLGNYLASYGYVVVSVDENVLNELSGENDARAILLLENIRQVLSYNNRQDNPLYQKIDESNLALAGHSRGGETVATAYLFNGYDCYPENGMYPFSYHFSIRSLIAIAPTVDQYQPVDHEVVLRDVNYLLLQGANDQDVTTNMGGTQYSHVIFSEDGQTDTTYIKSALYIAGANHGQFNTLWGKYDSPPPIAAFLNTESFLSQKKQQEILKIFAKVFLDQTLLGGSDYADLLCNEAKYAKNLPDTLYIQQYQTSDQQILCDYEEDSDLTTATDQNIRLQAKNVGSWTEEMARYAQEQGGERMNYVLHLRWKNRDDAGYLLTAKEPLDLTGCGISLDLCNWKEPKEDVWEDAVAGVKISLTDIHGNTAYADSYDTAMVYPALPVRLSKLQYLTGDYDYKHEYQTIRIDSGQFTTEDDFDYTRVRKICISFADDSSGNICMDNVVIYKN